MRPLNTWETTSGRFLALIFWGVSALILLAFVIEGPIDKPVGAFIATILLLGTSTLLIPKLFNIDEGYWKQWKDWTDS